MKNPEWIALSEAARFIAEVVYPREDKRTTEARVRSRIDYAIRNGFLHRLIKGGRIGFKLQPFNQWAANTWPELCKKTGSHRVYRIEGTLPGTKIISGGKSVYIRMPTSCSRLKEAYRDAITKLAFLEDEVNRLRGIERELTQFKAKEEQTRKARSAAGRKGGRPSK